MPFTLVPAASGMSGASGRIEGLGWSYVRTGLEGLEIWIEPSLAVGLPYHHHLRVPIDLTIGSQRYQAGIRSTPRNPYIWVCPDLLNSSGRKVSLAQVLAANGFYKNQPVVLV